MSEPETRAMYDFLVAFRPDRFISIHQPLFAVDTTDGGARNPRLARQLATELGLPLSPLRCWSTCRGSMTGWLTTHQAGFADTVEFGAAPSAGYLRGQATRAILHALGAVADTAARHDPALSVTALRAAPGQVTVAGAAQDPDRSGSRVRVSVTEHGPLVASVYAQTPRPTVTVKGRAVHGHGFAVSLAATPGRHVYCITAHNLGYGAGNTTRCRAVTVPAPTTASVPAP